LDRSDESGQLLFRVQANGPSDYCEVCVGGVLDTLIVVLVVAATKEKVIGASFCTKITTGEEITTILASILKANRTFS
jgi:hypothetical protein